MGLAERIKTEWNSLDQICNFFIDVGEGRAKRDDKDIPLKTEVYGILPNIVSLFYLFRHPIKIAKTFYYAKME